MKILHINSYYSNSTFYKNLYDEQKKQGIDLNVYVPVSSSFVQSNSNMGDYTHLSFNHNKFDRFFFFKKHKKIYQDLLNTYTRLDYSITHAHSLFSNGYIALKLKRQLGIPFIVAVRNTDINIFMKYMIHLRRLGLDILKSADKVIFISKSYQEKLLKKYIPEKYKNEIMKKSKVIPNGINRYWFDNKKISKRNNLSQLKLLYVGDINENKNILTTLKAIELLHEKNYNIKFTIVGQVKNNHIYDKIKTKSYVTYIEPIPRESLINIYRSHDIFVMPSIHETFGLVYAEALSQGIPIIYSKDQGFDGQIEDGLVGYSVTSTKANEIADKILEINSNYAKFSLNAIKNIKKFDWNIIESQYSDIYREILSEKVHGLKKYIKYEE